MNYGSYPNRKFQDLYRIIRCLDCLEVPTRKDNDRMSILTSRSEMNEEIKDKIRILVGKGIGMTQIC